MSTVAPAHPELHGVPDMFPAVLFAVEQRQRYPNRTVNGNAPAVPKAMLPTTLAFVACMGRFWGVVPGGICG